MRTTATSSDGTCSISTVIRFTASLFATKPVARRAVRRIAPTRRGVYQKPMSRRETRTGMQSRRPTTGPRIPASHMYVWIRSKPPFAISRRTLRSRAQVLGLESEPSSSERLGQGNAFAASQSDSCVIHSSAAVPSGSPRISSRICPSVPPAGV